MPELKDILTEKRAKHGNKAEVARKLGISSQKLGQYEKGRQKPKIEFYNKWKDVFGEDLLAETNVSIIAKNNTSVDKLSNNKISTPDADDILRQIVEGRGEYILINRELILEKYRLKSVEEIEEEKKDAERKVDEEKRNHEKTMADLKEREQHIHRLYNHIDDLMKKIPDSAGKIPELKGT